MRFVHPLFFVVLTAIAVGLCFLLGSLRGTNQAAGKYRTIDGLRGYLALFVFLHHSAISYFYATTGVWQLPPSNLAIHLGQASVSLFFMITAFLFYGKLIDGAGRSMDWGRFFVGRILRLMPLYALVIAVVLVLTLIESRGMLMDSPRHVLVAIIDWFSFTIIAEPPINGVGVQQFIAGVNWSLPYEWYFYFSLPLLALTCRIRVTWPYLLASLIVLVWMTQSRALPFYVAVFACGIAAAWAVRSSALTTFARSSTGSVAVVACIISVVVFFDSAYGFLPLILLAVAFALIASGADLFGLLLIKPSHVLGEIAYSIYLLHGMILFVGLKYVVGHDAVREMSPLQYWSVVCVLMGVLLVLSTITFGTIEARSMALTPKVMAWLRRHPSAYGTDVIDPLVDRVKPDTGGSAA